MNIFSFSMNVTSGLSATQKILFYFLYSFLYIISLIPFRVIYIFSDLLYFIAYHIVRYRRKLVRKNLTESFPQKSEKEIIEIERKFYHWLCDYFYETIKLASISKEEMRRRVKYTNLEVLQDLLDKGHSIAFYLGHYCNWEYVTSLGLYVPESCIAEQVYHPLENKVMDALMLKVRSRMGSESVAMSNIMRNIIASRNAEQKIIVGFISDQIPIYPNTHYWTDFLNHEKTLVITGTERLAKSAGLACLYMDISRPRRGYYEISFVPMTENSKDYPDFEITEMYIRLFEKTILKNPQYWLWTHNRWKRTYKGFMEWSDIHKKDINADFNR